MTVIRTEVELLCKTVSNPRIMDKLFAKPVVSGIISVFFSYPQKAYAYMYKNRLLGVIGYRKKSRLRLVLTIAQSMICK